MADENPTSGYRRIRGALKNLGHVVRRSTEMQSGVRPFAVDRAGIRVIFRTTGQRNDALPCRTHRLNTSQGVEGQTR